MISNGGQILCNLHSAGFICNLKIWLTRSICHPRTLLELVGYDLGLP